MAIGGEAQLIRAIASEDRPFVLKQPSIFVSHGAPDLLFSDAPARAFLETLLDKLPERPKAILVASAHWETRGIMVSGAKAPETIHDFRGFAKELYEVRYPAPGAPALAAQIVDLFAKSDTAAEIDPLRGLDHGAWVPLALMAPSADIPVLQISLQTPLGPAHHVKIGAALSVLRTEGVLIIGSGSFTHDLSEIFRNRFPENAPVPDWVSRFADWFDEVLQHGDVERLISYRASAPFAVRNHPTEEHLLPLFVALGAGGLDRATRLHKSATYGVLRMDAYAFGAAD
jgi:4,5-DOPA dioxygenase extradiol